MAEQKRKLNVKKLAKTTAVAAVYTFASMYAGDKIGIEKNFLVPAKDYVTGVETEEGFADYSSVDLVTIINEDEKREVFLSYDKNEGDYKRTTPISDNGYAFPESLTERIDAFLNEKREELENLKGYDSIEKMKDKIGLMIDYYKMKARQVLDEYFGGE